MKEARRSLEVIGRQWEQALGRVKASLQAQGPLWCSPICTGR